MRSTSNQRSTGRRRSQAPLAVAQCVLTIPCSWKSGRASPLRVFLEELPDGGGGVEVLADPADGARGKELGAAGPAVAATEDGEGHHFGAGFATGPAFPVHGAVIAGVGIGQGATFAGATDR